MLDVTSAARPVGALEDPAHASAEVGVLTRPRQRLAPVLMGALDILEAAAGPFGLLPVVAPACL